MQPEITAEQAVLMGRMKLWNGLYGPDPAYQGDYHSASGPALRSLIESGLVSADPLRVPFGTDGLDTPYLMATHRYALTAAGHSIHSSGASHAA